MINKRYIKDIMYMELTKMEERLYKYVENGIDNYRYADAEIHKAINYRIDKIENDSSFLYNTINDMKNNMKNQKKCFHENLIFGEYKDNDNKNIYSKKCIDCGYEETYDNKRDFLNAHYCYLTYKRKLIEEELKNKNK